ncbi:MAG TPA: carbon storage regulator [Ktedonobacterales bacterium]|jgi:carbon storage regulator
MLVLRRKAGEAIVLNGVITIHVLAVEGERVKLGISAPPEVVIVRSELLENQGPMPGGPASSGSYWGNREGPRDPGSSSGRYPRDPGSGGRYPTRDPRQTPPPAPPDPQGNPSDPGPDGSGPRRAAPLYSGPRRES